VSTDKKKMVTKARREREKQQRIESIIESAKRVFFSKGYIKATMDEIALGAEISKPTVYLYFKNKDDLYFSLMGTVIEDIGIRLQLVETRLMAGEYFGGSGLIEDLFKALYHSYEIDRDAFRIVQMFQQAGLVAELDSEMQASMNEKGRSNFDLLRRIMTVGMERRLLKRVNVYCLADLFWAVTVGVIQLEDIKGDDRRGDKFKKKTLDLAEKFLIEALAEPGADNHRGHVND
jgi:TetR/AcrR family transcriptional regulator